MAVPNLIVEYFNTSSKAWVEFTTAAGSNALLSCSITKRINEPTEVQLDIANPSPRPKSTTASESRGRFTNLFKDNRFLTMRLRDAQSKLILFKGRTYDDISAFDRGKANHISCTLYDELQLLENIAVKDAKWAFGQVPLGTYSKRNTYIKRTMEALIPNISDHIDFSDTAKWNDSAADFEDDDGVSVHADSNTYYDIETDATTLLGLFRDLAEADPFSDSSTEPSFGWQFQVDAATVTCDTVTGSGSSSGATDHSGRDINPAADIHYYKPGTRPGLDNSTDVNTQRYGLTVKLPDDDWGAVSDSKKDSYLKEMLEGSTFSHPDIDLTTAASVEFVVKKSATNAADEIYVVNDDFELMQVTLGGSGAHFTHASDSTGKSVWENHHLFIKQGFPVDGSTDQSSDTNNPVYLYEHSQTSPCAVLHFAKHTGSGAGSVLLSHVYNAAYSLVMQGETIAFRAFPTGSSAVRLYTRKSQSDGATTAPYFDITPSTGRLSNQVGITKRNILSINTTTLQSSNELRTYIYSKLDRGSSSRSVKAAFSISRYPYYKLTAGSNKISGNTHSLALHAGSTTINDSARTPLNNTDTSTTFTIATAGTVILDDVITIASSGEAMLVTGVDGADITVTRGYNSTTKTTHANGAAVTTQKAFTTADNVSYASALHSVNDARLFGAQVGMVIAELSSTGTITRYAHISQIGMSGANGSILYGDPAITDGTRKNDTSDGSIIDTTKEIAIFIPAEPGHYMRVQNGQWDIDYDMLIEEITYRWAPTSISAQIRGTGLQDNVTRRARVTSGVSRWLRQFSVDTSKMLSLSRQYAFNQGYILVNGTLIPESKDEVILASTTNGDTKVTIQLANLTKDGRQNMVLNTGTIDIAGSGTTIGDSHVLYARPVSSYQGSNTVIATPISTYKPRANDVLLGWAQADRKLTQGTTTLAANVTSTTATTITVAAVGATLTNPDGFVVGDVIQIGNEYLKITAINTDTNVLTVVRGYESSNGFYTPPGTPSSSTPVTKISSLNTDSNALATVKLNGAGSFGDKGSIDIREISEGTIPMLHSNSIAFKTQSTTAQGTTTVGEESQGIVFSSDGFFAYDRNADAKVSIATELGPMLKITNNGTIVVGKEDVSAKNFVSIDDGGITFAKPGSGTEASTGSMTIQFDHNSGVGGNSSTSSTEIRRQGSAAVGEISQGGRNLVIRDNGGAIDDAAHQYATSTTADSSTLAVGSYAKFFNIAPLAPRYFAQTHTVSSAEKSGSKAKPVYTFYGDDNTGIYSNGPDQVNIATGGTAALTITSSLLSLSGGVQTTGHILIGTSTAPSATSTLRINEGGGAAISDNWLTWSRAEYKENIADLSSGYLQKLINSPPKSWLKKPFVSAEDIKIAAINEFGQDEWDKIFPTETAHRNKALWNMPEGEMKTWIDNWAESQRVELRKLPQYQIKHIGSIADADSTNTYLPEIVANDDNNEPEGITVMSYIGILHAAIIELKAEIDALKNG